MEETRIITVEHLSKVFPIRGNAWIRKKQNIPAVDDVSFSVMKGEVLGIVGESGSGKSTIARMLLGLEKPTGGTVTYHIPKSAVQMVFQDPYASLNPARKVGQAVMEPILANRLAGSKQEARLKAEELLETVGLSRAMYDRFPHAFSGGQRQRIGIARALSVSPELLVCDEAVSALDVSVQAQILNLFDRLKKTMGLSMIFIGHDLAVIQHISDRVIVLYQGSVMEILPCTDLLHQARHPYTLELLSSIPGRSEKREAPLPEEPAPIPGAGHGGCKFYSRCSRRTNRCLAEQPELKEVASQHFIRCLER